MVSSIRQVLAGAALAIALLASPTADLAAQIPSQQELMRLLREYPEAVRERIRQSGLTPAQIRAELVARGLPPTALDQFLSGTDPTATGVAGAETLSALEALGTTEVTPDGLEYVPFEVGRQYRWNPADPRAGAPIFGMDVFTRASSQFQPLLHGPVPEGYRVGPGDRMVLVLTGEVELARELIVTREGFIVIPDVGQIGVANLTMGDLRALLRSRLSTAYSGIDGGTTTFDVTISQLRTNQIYVIGEVAQAGAYQLSSVATVMNALYAAGGPTPFGSLRDVRLRRRDGEEVSLDLYSYLLRGDVSGDVMLEQGDLIFVPLTGRRVLLSGAVARPARYELSGSEDLIDVLRASGGFAADASRRGITIHRVLRPAERGPGRADRVALNLGLDPAEPDAPNYLGGVAIPPVGLQDGDSIVVHSVPALESTFYVSITGMVLSPGRFPWREGMTIRDVVELSRGPIVGADLREAEVSRLPTARTTGQLAERLRVPLDSSYLTQRDAEGRYHGPAGIAFPPAGASPEFELEPFDHVLILRQPDFEMPQTVKILGEVSVPGEYTLVSKTDRVADLVERAEGLLGTAYEEGARLVRAQDDLGRIDFDLVAALEDPDGEDNLILQPGDSLYIPVFSPTVEVQGAVTSPGTVLYQAGEGVDYYIENTGGFSNNADEDRIAVRYANGQARTTAHFLLWSSDPDPGPGSTITVPLEDPADATDVRGLIRDIVAIAGSMTTLIVVLTR